MSLLTLPVDYLDATKVSPLGIVLAHGSDAEGTWRAALLERLACTFAAAGHVVARYYCPLKEQVRCRLPPPQPQHTRRAALDPCLPHLVRFLILPLSWPLLLGGVLLRACACHHPPTCAFPAHQRHRGLQRRHRILEKSFDVAAASPYAAGVKRWLFVGYDNGARIAAGGGCCACRRCAGVHGVHSPWLHCAPHDRTTEPFRPSRGATLRIGLATA